mmetsp:Transcript_15895/g.28727  ORF Transcript_15895/g.28727 Transcript_15895/m.28727 type:complete len:94 (+) Transcript_15895:1350-1631(+)
MICKKSPSQERVMGDTQFPPFNLELYYHKRVQTSGGCGPRRLRHQWLVFHKLITTSDHNCDTLFVINPHQTHLGHNIVKSRFEDLIQKEGKRN